MLRFILNNIAILIPIVTALETFAILVYKKKKGVLFQNEKMKTLYLLTVTSAFLWEIIILGVDSEIFFYIIFAKVNIFFQGVFITKTIFEAYRK